MARHTARIIAFYLPQFYPTPENNLWWGRGFTEWTNVGKARPLFKGHYQPRVPSDLGYYDLRVAEVRKQQAELAEYAGIEGFCYWHYWFGNNDRLLTTVFDEVMMSGEPDYPFCLGWANHSWYKKTWTTEGNDELLKEQKYAGIDDYTAHFKYVVKAFRDRRYIRHDNRPVFYVFDPESLPQEFIDVWNKLAVEHGLDGICFVGRLKDDSKYQSLLDKGFAFLAPERTNDISTKTSRMKRRVYQLLHRLAGRPRNCYTYKTASRYFINKEFDSKHGILPSIVPNWDHSPRSGRNGFMLHDSTPDLFAVHVNEVLRLIEERKAEDRIIFLKSWNEWGEGNYMEPDLKWGHKYIQALRNEIDKFDTGK